MGDDTKFMVWVGTLVAVTLVTVASCSSYETKLDNAAIVEMVKTGANPLEAKCAVSPSETVCNTVAVRNR